ncbi:MAG TPA: FAD-dependent oxidoreductase [Candidatus Dormibacteraeota bacterium]|nr:FAD-dependent oxidoreductase [Candidatus Dormibacteraeota bacterium]
MTQLPSRARAIVIGGGITGTSIAYHLALAGWKDTVLLEKADLTSGSTCHAAGLVTQFNPSLTMMRFRRYSIELYRELGIFDSVGSLRFASSREQLMEQQRGVSRARAIGLDVELVSAEQAAQLMPSISTNSLFGAVWMPGDGALDPHTATFALARAARDLGVTVLTDTRVTGLALSSRGEIQAVQTEAGRIEAEVVVIACGIWAPQVAAMAGAFVVSTPVDHQHAALQAVEGAELPQSMPCFRDPDNLIYGKAEAGGVILGGYELNPNARWIDGVPWEHAGTSVTPDQPRFEPLLKGAARRFPFISDAGIIKLVCHPDAMTPDANPLLGPVPGVRGLYMAAGLSLNGFGGAGGIGKSLTQLITSGDSELDLYAYRPWRFGPVHRDHRYVAELAKETYRYYYFLRYPYDADEWGRPRRTSALHHRMQDLGAVFGAKHGWERPEHFEPGRPWRRAGADQRQFGWTRPPWFELQAEEHRAFRERVGIIDMTSFGKIELDGPGALPLLERVAGNLVDRTVGSVVYTQLLDRRGGIAGDVTITRLGRHRFRLVTGAGYVNSDLGWLRLEQRDEDGPVDVRETTEELCVIGMWGPRSRQVLESVTDDDVSEDGFPFMQARDIRIEGFDVFAQRVTYVGELGWEFYLEPSVAMQVWDRLIAAGQTVGIRPGGYRALDSLRMEKGYRYYGTDLTLLDNPLEAGLGFCVRFDKGDFNGREALIAAKAAGIKRRLRTLLVGERDYVTIYGGEAVYADGSLVGRIRSCGYGFTIRRNIAYSYLPVGLAPGTRVEVDVFGRHVPAEVSTDAALKRDQLVGPDAKPNAR